LTLYAAYKIKSHLFDLEGSPVFETPAILRIVATAVGFVDVTVQTVPNDNMINLDYAFKNSTGADSLLAEPFEYSFFNQNQEIRVAFKLESAYSAASTIERSGTTFRTENLNPNLSKF
jgi:hypothetical protein